MSGRSNWYSDHPPACTCADCSRARPRGRRQSRPVSQTPGARGKQSTRVGSQIIRRRRRLGAWLWKSSVLIIILVVIAGAAAYHQGYVKIGVNTEGIKQRLGILPEPNSSPNNQVAGVILTREINTARESPTGLASEKQEPAPAPIPTSPPATLQKPEPITTPTDLPANLSTLRTAPPTSEPTATLTPVPTAMPSPTPAPVIIPAQVTNVSFVGAAGYTLSLKLTDIPEGDSEEHLRTIVSYGDGTTDEAITQFIQKSNVDYFGKVVVDRDRVQHPDLQWVRDHIIVEILLETAGNLGQAAAPAPTTAPKLMPALRTTPAPDLRHGGGKQYMLKLINAEREKAGVPPVVLGDNHAAQLHAEISLENCVSSHWGIDGLKPYMRYSLAGGYQSNGENASGSSYCIKASDGYRALGSIEAEIRETMEGWMDSPGHRRNILDRWHKKINIGLAWDRYNIVAVQHFEGDYVEYYRLPTIVNDILTLAGETKNGARFADDRSLGVQVYYDTPPRGLTRGQVARTYCYGSGRLVAELWEPLTGGWYYEENEYNTTYRPCPDPYEVSSDAPEPECPPEANDMWQKTYNASRSRTDQSITVPWITASEWNRAVDYRIRVEGQGRNLCRDRRPERRFERAWRRRIHALAVE